jgi:hypothetical protein
MALTTDAILTSVRVHQAKRLRALRSKRPAALWSGAPAPLEITSGANAAA